MERDFKGVWIPKEIWLCKELSLQEKAFIVEIDSLDNSDGCFASNKHFSDFFDLSLGRVSQVINTLKIKGYINIEYITKDKVIEKRVITINRPPYPIKFSKGGYLENDDGGIKETKGGYLENAKDNNTLSNNTYINNKEIYKESISLIVDYLNQKTNQNYRVSTYKTQALITARLKEGYRLEDFQKVINTKCAEWLGTDMQKYLRPETLFGNKFENYLNQIPKEDPKNNVSNIFKKIYEKEVNK